MKLRHYEPDFKKKVAVFAQRKGNQAAKKRFGVSDSNIRRWKKIQNDNLDKAVVKNTIRSKNPKRKSGIQEEIQNKLGMVK